MKSMSMKSTPVHVPMRLDETTTTDGNTQSNHYAVRNYFSGKPLTVAEHRTVKECTYLLVESWYIDNEHVSESDFLAWMTVYETLKAWDRKEV